MAILVFDTWTDALQLLADFAADTDRVKVGFLDGQLAIFIGD